MSKKKTDAISKILRGQEHCAFTLPIYTTITISTITMSNCADIKARGKGPSSGREKERDGRLSMDAARHHGGQGRLIIEKSFDDVYANRKSPTKLSHVCTRVAYRIVGRNRVCGRLLVRP